jgi:hypothetical protein
MNTQAKVLIGILVAALIGLGAALGVVLATGDSEGDDVSHGMMNGNDGFAGMMGAMSSGDSDAMLGHMRDVLGAEGYQRMVDHFRDHRNGGPMTGDPEIDDMMHRMMDGMMQRMPMDAGGMMPGAGDTRQQTPTLSGQDAHHETPTARP